MEKRIIDRVFAVGNYMVDTGNTVRELAKIFGVSKSTIHKDLSERLLEIDSEMYEKVAEILKYHTSVRHIRGGDATRLKFFLKKC